MREIKFRAWDKQRHHMFDVEQLSYNLRGELVSIYGFGRDFSNDPDMLMGEEPNLDRAVLMQYTGLHDKNGKEIYEGDILENRKYRSVVKFAGGKYLADLIETIQAFDLIGETRGSKVIGNIYENPELLGARDEQK